MSLARPIGLGLVARDDPDDVVEWSRARDAARLHLAFGALRG